MSATTSHRPNGRVALAGDFERVSLVENSDVTINPARSYMDVDIKTTNSFKSLALSALKMDMSRPISGSFVHNASLKERRAYLSYVLGKEESTPASEASKALSSQPSSGVSSSGDSDVDSSDNESDSSDPTSPAAGAVDFSGPSPSSDSFLEPPEGSQSTNVYSFLHNKLPAGVAVDGEATFSRSSNGSTFLELQPHSSLLVRTNVLEAPSKNGKMNSTYEYSIEMEIQLPSLPSNSLSLLQGLDNEQGLPSEGVVFIDRFGCVGTRGKYSSKQSGHAVVPGKWTTVKLTVQRGKGANTAIIEARINGDLAVSVPIPSVDSTVSVSPKELWLFRSSSSSFMPGVRIRNVRVGRESTRTATEDFNLLRERIEAHDTQLFTHMSLRTLFRRPPPAWMHPIFECFLPSSSHVPKSDLSVLMPVLSLIFEQVCSNSVMLSSLSEEKRASLASQLAFLQDFKVTAKVFQDLVNLSSESAATIYVKHISKQLGVLKVGERAAFPFKHKFRAQDSHFVSDYIVVVEHTADSFYCLTVVDVDIDGGLRYHPCSMATPNEVRYKVCLPVANIPRESILDDAFWVSLAALSWSSGDRDSRSLLYTRLLPTLSPGLSFAPLAAILPTPTEVVPTPAEVNPLHAHGIALQASSAAAVSKSNSAAVGDITRAATELGVDISSFPEEDEAFRASTTAMYSAPADSSDPFPEAEFRQISTTAEATCFGLLSEMFYFVLRRSGLCPAEAGLVFFALRSKLLDMAFNDHSFLGALSKSDKAVLTGASGALARDAVDLSEAGILPSGLLSTVLRAVKVMNAAVAAMPPHEHASDAPPPTVQLTDGGLTFNSQHSLFPLAERIARTDDPNSLVGDRTSKPVAIPIDFLRVPLRATTFPAIVDALRHCDRICATVISQASLIKNPHHLVTALIEDTITRVVPSPRSPGQRGRDSCVWSNTPMTYSTQVEVMLVLERIALSFLSASYCITTCRATDTSRIVLMQVLAMFADALMRAQVSDIPSELAETFIEEEFGFRVGAFLYQAEISQFHNPELMLARANVLDYFEGQSVSQEVFVLKDNRGDHGTFAWVYRVCQRMGFPTSALHDLVIGDHQTLLVLNYPEFGAFRTICFWAKIVLSTSPVGSMPLHQTACQLSLGWSGKQYIISISHSQFSIKHDKDHRFPSPASLAKLAFPLKPKTEDDILHIPTLTSFNGALGQADSELLHSYLTVPYLRIPLFLGFLASNPDRVHALKSPELCDLFDAVIFEPGTHLQMKDELIVPTHVPALPRERESLASPYGLLINELVKSPSFIGESLQNIIMHTLSLDTGTVKATTTTIILYVLRLTTRIENYMSFVLALATGSHESISSANLRFDMQPAEVEALRLALSGLQALHQGRIRAMLEEWNREIQRDIYLKISVMGKAKVDEKKKRDANADSLRSHTQSQRAKTADITSSKNAAGTDVSKASVALSLRDSVGRNRVFHQKSIGLEEEERKVAAMKNVAKDSHFAAGTSAHTGLNSLKSSGMGHELDGMAPDATVWTPESLTLLSCVVHLHLMLIHRNTSTMHAQAALALTSSMMFLTTHHTWGPPLADIDGVGTLAVPEPHVYELMQKQRRHLIAFLSSRRQSTLNRIMDTTVRVTTLVGSIGDTKDKSGITGDDDLASQARAMFHRSWGRVSGIQNRGKFALPARSDAFLKLEKQRSKNDLQEEDGSAGEARMNASTLDMSASGSTREIPELANGLELDADVDLQLLQLTFKSAHLSALPSAVAQASDIVDLFGNGTIQCALVEIAERRQWYRLVGRGYDVQRWTYQSHEPSYASEREYEPSELFSHEDWIAQIFEPIRLQFFNDPFNPRLFFMPTEKTQVNADIALVSVVDKNNGRFVCDVFVYKNRKMAHVYVTKSVGGRFYRVLVYASNAQFSLYHMQPSTGDRDTLWPFWSRHAAGHPENDDPAFSYSNVTITRDPEVEENLSGETETYLPSRVLRGILPHALLDKYRFWQDEKDNLRGYPIDESSPHIVCVDLIDLKRTDGTEEPGISARITRVLRKTLLSRLLARVNSVRLASKEKQRRAMREGADPTGGDDDGLTDAERRAAHQRAHLSVLKERGTTSSDFLPDDSTADEQLIAERDLHQHYDRRFKEKILEEERRAERRAAKRSAAATDDERKTTLDEEELELVNLLHTPRYGSLYQLASLLSRVDSLSHVLAWKRLGDKPSVFPEDKLLFDPTAAPRSGSTKAAHGTVKFAKSEEELTADAINELQLRIGQCVELPLVELPRVGLSFHYKADPRGEMRLYSLDHADLFVSNKRSELMSKLILGIPHALLLSNHNDEMSILVPCFCVVRPFIRNSPLSTELVIDRANTEWLEKLDSRYFLYPVHVSLSFVFTPTLASALYLMLLRFLNRNYLETFRLADTISTDTDFSVEESQIFSALGEAYTDQCPDAEACRLKISHATIDGDVPTPWVPVFVAANYAGSLPFISATCRLPLHAELYVLRKVVSAADLPLISRLFAIDSSFKAIRMVTAINRLQLLTAMHFKRPSYVVRAAPGRALAPVYSVSAPQIETLIIAAGHSLEAPLADNEEEIVSDKEEEDSDDDEPLPVPRDNDPYSLREFMNLQDAGTVEPIVENIVDYASMTMEQRIEAFQQAYKHSDLKQQDELAFQMSVSDAVDASKKKTSDPLTKKKKRSGPKMGNLKRYLVNSISTLFDDGGKPFQGFSASNALAAHPDARVEAAPLLSMTKKIDNSLLKERVLPAVVSTNTVSLFSKSITGSNGGLGNSTTTSGFVLLYSLLCGHVRARVKTSDCGQSLARLSFFSSPDFSVPSKGALLLRILCLRPDVASVMPSWKEFCKGKGPFSVNDFIDTAIGVLAKLYQVDPKLVLPPAPIYPPPTEAIANGRKKAAARRALRLQDPDSGLSKVFPKLPLPCDFDALFVVSEPPKLRGFEREDVPAETRVISGTGERWACEPAVNKFGNDDVSEFYGFSSGTQKRKKNEGSKDSYIKTMKRAAAVSTVEGILPTAAQFAWVLPSAPRAWVIPRLSDYACSERFFIPEQSVTVVKQAILDLSRGLSKKRTNVESIDGLSADVLGPLFDSPLTPAELDHFVASATRASKGLPPISAELPFDVSSHPEAQSSIAVSMQRRLTDDISLYAHLQNTGREPIVSGLGEMEANAIATFAAGATEIQQKIRENLNALSTALLALRKRDSAFVDHALGLVTRLANHVALPPPLLESQASFIPKTSLFVMNPVVDAFFDGRTTKENEATTERLKFELRRIAGQEAELWTDFLIGSLLSSRAAFDIQKVNPYCTTDRVRAVLVLVEALLLHANRIGQINRCLQEASDLETLLARAEASAASGTASEGVKSAFAAGLLQKSQTLARLLTSSRHYVDRVPPSQCAESATAVSADEELQSSEHGEAAADSRMRTLGAHIRPRDPRFDERAALALSIDALISQNVAAPVCALSEKNQMEQMLERIHIDPAEVAPVNDIIDSAVSIGALSTTERALAAVQVLPRTSSQADVSGVHSYDPRFLVFEFTWNILLRKTQVTMVREFSDSIRSGKSTVKQMIMGAGKTTVVAPLLTLMFGDGKTLVMEVVPPALLEFSRSVMRSTFSTVMYKRVSTFFFDRASIASQVMLDKIRTAVVERGVVISTPTSVKSVMLKLLEIQKILSDPSLPRPPALESQRDILVKMLLEFKRGVLFMDEVDLILHPLKSELNFPIGPKHDLDFNPLRWRLAMHIIDAVFYSESQVVPFDFRDSKRAIVILEAFNSAVQRGHTEKHLQSSPHLILLNEEYYQSTLLPILTDWVMLWLESNHTSGVSPADMRAYITASGAHDAELTTRISDNVAPKHIQALNLARDWLRSYAPHVLQKIDRVSFGLLSAEDLRRNLTRDPYMPVTRAKLAIPFLGKDVPSESSEFAHPDVIIGLTYMAYRYEGLRYIDFLDVIDNIRSAFSAETGPPAKRPSSLRYARWVAEAGGSVRGQGMEKEILQSRAARLRVAQKHESSGFRSPSRGVRSPAVSVSVHPQQSTLSLASNDDVCHASQDPTEDEKDEEIIEDEPRVEVLSLRLLKRSNVDQMSTLFDLLCREPTVIQWHLNEALFPTHMRHQHHKISASGVEIGGDMLFARRVGFSGTPSDLLPLELGSCGYEKASDGQMMSVLTSPEFTSFTHIAEGWTVQSLLTHVATARAPNGEPAFHALIDTGALITGMSNYDVAAALLDLGLKWADGVVFLDELDRKMILIRATRRVVKLQQCGIPVDRRFAFYDQVHTTGMDISHRLDACAAITLGKDMTFRDYAQGAYRMRGLSKGQTVHLLVTPEIHRLLNRQLKLCATASVTIDDFESYKGYLQAVTAWLVVNSMRSERIQFSQLCLQNIGNVWRKAAFAKLVRSHSYFSLHQFRPRSSHELEIQTRAQGGDSNSVVKSKRTGDGGDTSKETAFNTRRAALRKARRERMLAAKGITMAEFDETRKAQKAAAIAANEMEMSLGGRAARKRVLPHDPLLEQALSLFSEPIDFSIKTEVPKLRVFSESVQQLVDAHSAFISTTEQSEACGRILGLIRHGAMVDEGHLTAEMVQTMEEEKEKQQEQEQEQEIEIEKCVDAAYSRDNEAQTPWLFSALASPPSSAENASLFYPASDFKLYKRSPIKLSPSLYVSNNYFDKRWSGARRIKNTIMYLEWIPDAASLTPFTSGAEASHSDPVKLLSHYSRQISLLTKMFDEDGSGDLNATELAALLRAATNEPNVTSTEAEAMLSLMAGKDEKFVDQTGSALTNAGIVGLLTSGILSPGERGRFFLTISLAEAETLRRILHSRLNLPLLQDNPGFQLALRCTLYENAIFDKSFHFGEGPKHQRLMAWKSLQFLDSQTHFDEAGINILLNSMDADFPDARRRFFDTIMSCRRRMQKRAADAPVNRVFVLPSRFHLLSNRAVSWRLASAIKSVGLQLYDAFRAFDTNKNGALSPDEIYGAAQFLRLPAMSVDDVLDYTAPVDPAVGWSMLYKGFSDLLRDPDVPIDTSSVDDEEQDGGDLPEVPPVDPVPFLESISLRQIAHAAGIKQRDLRDRADNASYARLVQKFGSVKPKNGGAPFQENRIPKENIRDETGGVVAEAPQFPIQSGETFISFFDRTLPHGVSAYGDSAAFVSDPVGQGQHRTFLRLGNAGLTVKLPATIQPNQDLVVSVAFRPCSASSITHARRLREMAAARAERRASETPEQRNARREARREAHLMKSGAQTASTEASTVNSIRRSLFSLSKKKGASATSVSSPTAIRNSVGVEATGTVIDSSDLDSDSDDDRATLHQEATLKALQGEKRDAEARVNSKVVPSFNQFLAADDEERYEIPLFTTLSPSLDAKHVLYHTKRNIASMYPPMIDSAPHKMPLNPKDSFSVVAARCSHGTADLQVFINNRICQSYPIRGNVSFRPTVGLFIAPEGAKIGEPFVDVIAVLVSQENPNKDTRMLKWLEDTARATESHQHFLGSHRSYA